MARNDLPFDNRKPLRPPVGKDVTAQFVSGGAAPISVSALVARVKEALLDKLPGRLTVIGQISNFKRQSSGHLYFSLKDASSCISAVMFAGDAAYIRFTPADGLEVVAEGKVDVWEPQGKLQLYVKRLSPNGTGALELAFRQLKERLGKEGLFEQSHKVPLPRFSRAVGVITSPTGAAVRDIGRTLRRRWPAGKIYLLPVKVQGEGAAEEIAQAVALMDANAARFGIDVIIVGRGGGSLEDLWAFNEEVVARAIYACRTPIISGVGHEVDFTIADFVADVRAATPTAAAEIASPDGAELSRHTARLAGRLQQRIGLTVTHARNALAAIGRSVVFRDPSAGVRSAHQRIDDLANRLRHGLLEQRHQVYARLAAAEKSLTEHHPRRLCEQAAGKLEQVRGNLAWALGHLAKTSGDALAQKAQRLAQVHPRHRLALADQRLQALARQLESMSYRAVLRRGFTVTRVEGKIAASAARVAPGSRLETEFADGKVHSIAAGSAPPRKKREQPAGPSLFAQEDQSHG